MSDWTGGYVADIDYTFGYYKELNPLRIKLAFLNRGLAFPEVGTACELGFGQGLSANVHAAASVTRWYGTDFNPAQAGCAREMADVSGNGAKLYDEAFAEFALRDDLPDFDYVALHGIWSWISDENRHLIVDFIRRKLKVGGVLYVSYNTLPGWAAFAPMRHLMTEHAELSGSGGAGMVSRVNSAVQFAKELLNTDPLFLRANPQVRDRIEKLENQNRHYLAHEYFNRDWHPMHFATMAAWLEDAKISYACSAHYLDHVDSVNLTDDQQKFLADITDTVLRESVRDFMVNQQFRRDYWVKGARQLSPLERLEALRQVRVVLVRNRADVSLKVNGARGEASMSDKVYNPILDYLADHGVRSLQEIEQAMQGQGINMPSIVQAVMVLEGAGSLSLAQDSDEVINSSRTHSEKLNHYLTRKARSNDDISWLSSPVVGGGIPTPRFQQLFLLALKQGKKQPEEWAEFVWQILHAQGQQIVKEGKTLQTAEENRAELLARAEEFAAKQLPLMKALQVF